MHLPEIPQWVAWTGLILFAIRIAADISRIVREKGWP